MSRTKTFATSSLQKPIIRYLIMAASLVVVELFTFFIVNSVLGISYLIATPASLLLVIFLNWYLGKLFVFKTSRHKAHTEFMLVMIASLVGLGIQLTVTAFAVEILLVAPLLGKMLAIAVTFFWNYWIRKNYIFKASKIAT
jgi:putative flippase GtrA